MVFSSLVIRVQDIPYYNTLHKSPIAKPKGGGSVLIARSPPRSRPTAVPFGAPPSHLRSRRVPQSQTKVMNTQSQPSSVIENLKPSNTVPSSAAINSSQSLLGGNSQIDQDFDLEKLLFDTSDLLQSSNPPAFDATFDLDLLKPQILTYDGGADLQI